MPLTFPSSPSNGQTYTVGARTWTWNGSIWELNSAAIGVASVTDAELASGAVTEAKIASSAVTAGKIASSAVTHDKLHSTLSAVTICTSSTKPASPFDGQVIYMTDADQTAVWDGSAWVGLERSRDRNVVINGAFNIWQRGTSSGTLSIGGGTYVGPDRWWFYNNGFTSTISRQSCGSTLPQFQYCTRLQRTSGQTGTSALVLNSPQETINSVRLAGKTVTLSFYARASSSVSSFTSLRLSVRTGTGTDQNNLGAGAYTGLATPISFVPTLTASWQRFSGSASVDSTATEISVEMQFTPTGTAGASDYVEITGIQLEEGAVATPFEFEDYGTTLRKCQRYCYVIGKENNNYSPMGFTGNIRNATTALVQTRLPQNMRSAPTVTVDAAANFIIDDGPSTYTPSAFALDRYSANALMMYATVSGATAGRGVIVYGNGSSAGVITISAEL